ncbi:MAG: p-cresol methylhydroxylase, partial [Alphaproteobacteria bacterium HGW-Alphaproteobacteria-9]
GPGHPATMLLEQLGRPVPALIGRKDLELDYLRSVVRQGLIEMPPFRSTELSDEQIEDIYKYIKSAEPPKQAPALAPE